MARILVAEHNKSTLTYLYSVLKAAGNSVDAVDNSLDAWRAANKACYDILIVDIVMPGMDGFVLAQKALQDNPGIQVIFITGFAAVAMDTYNTPAYAPQPMTSKPFHMKEIVGRVRYLMGEAELPVNMPTTQAAEENNVIYAEFGGK